MSATRRHLPPPTAWPGRAQAVQPALAFTAVRRPAGDSRASPGEELIALSDGLYQFRAQGSRVLSRPSGIYNFVRVQGETPSRTATMLSARAPHAALASGRPVLYAGTAGFDGGRLRWWSNYSGTYQPIADLHRQAALPGELFVPWQKMQLGGFGMQRGMLVDRRKAPDAKPDDERAAPAPRNPPETAANRR